MFITNRLYVYNLIYTYIYIYIYIYICTCIYIEIYQVEDVEMKLAPYSDKYFEAQKHKDYLLLFGGETYDSLQSSIGISRDIYGKHRDGYT